MQVWQEISEEEVVRRKNVSLPLFIIFTQSSNVFLLNLAVTIKKLHAFMYNIEFHIYKELHVDISSSEKMEHSWRSREFRNPAHSKICHSECSEHSELNLYMLQKASKTVLQKNVILTKMMNVCTYKF